MGKHSGPRLLGTDGVGPELTARQKDVIVNALDYFLGDYEDDYHDPDAFETHSEWREFRRFFEDTVAVFEKLHGLAWKGQQSYDYGGFTLPK